MLKNLLMIGLLAHTVGSAAQTAAAHFDMSLTPDGSITESVTGAAYRVNAQLPPCTAAGADGQALRFDGYSNYVKAGVPVNSFSKESLTVSVVLAAETYPMMKVDVAEDTPTYGTVCGNLDGKQGFALQLSSQGHLRFQFGSTYANGYLFTIDGTKTLPRGQWCRVTAVLDKAANAAKLYLNGEEIGSIRMSRADIAHSTADFYIGKDATDVKSGPFLINTFCGLIDDIAVYNEVAPPTAPLGASIGQRADFSYPLSRYSDVAPSGAEGGAWRPQFHGMPSGGWTNETHGMIYSGGRYHVFFQKNANGPYMSRLHWGHISSENLYDWREEPIAIAPGEAYDLKGCWSGCVYEENGTPYILYTGVDNAKARIVKAKAQDDGLVDWEKQGVIIDGRPAGLSDDFRDPYYFESDGQRYIIVGTSKNGVGACTLHRYQNGAWTNDGTIFFQGSTANLHGTFWEMPNVTPMGDGRYLFTCTPLGTGAGVRTLCWVGTIGSDGKFTPLGGQGGALQYLEMGGISHDGYGLLSPTICRHEGKTLLLGIVPDKLPTQANYEMGWAHNYSLPREISLDANGQIVQKPYSGLSAMRTSTVTTVDETLLGQKTLVSGRQIELLGEFTPTTGTCGFRFLRDATLTYDADTRRLTLDLTALSRTANDGGAYNGIYAATLTEPLSTLHVYLDGSIADIFVNDRWAFSVRLFPTDASATQTEVFATAQTTVKVSAWTLDAKRTTGIATAISQPQENGTCYDLCGRKVSQPGKGIYIRNGRKYVRR
ncbi:MAG: GH32 C-terminal domain-containing protein [Prevotella sp.]|nr:GH32 C-terminal domain-containing protein [Prevotella sp.]